MLPRENLPPVLVVDLHASPLIYRGSVCGDTLHATPGESSLVLGVACAGTGPACFPENVTQIYRGSV